MTDRWPNRTLRLRSAWRSASLALAFVWLIGLVSLWYWPGQVRNAIRDGVTDHLDALSAEMDLAEFPIESDTLLVLPAPERFVQVIGPDGQVVAASSELVSHGPLIPVTPGDVSSATAPPMTIATPGDRHGESFVMTRTIRIGGVDYLGIVGASLDRVTDGRDFVLWAAGLGGPLVALLVGLGVWWSVTFAMRPVQALAEEADRLGQGHGPWQVRVSPETAEMRRLALSFDHLLAQIRATLERERAFLDDASHELRTPIAVARGELDLALGSDDLATMRRGVESSIEELDRLDRLAADLLLLARARGADPSSFSQVDLGGLARRAVASVIRSTRTSPRPQVTIEGEASTVGDDRALERAVTNIVTNAIGHCDSRVEVVVAQSAGKSQIGVADDGPGFNDDLLGTATHRFTRTRDGRHGTGLGLAIASDIAEAHGGTLEIRNRAEGGAEVLMRFPADPGISAGVQGAATHLSHG